MKAKISPLIKKSQNHGSLKRPLEVSTVQSYRLNSPGGCGEGGGGKAEVASKWPSSRHDQPDGCNRRYCCQSAPPVVRDVNSEINLS